MSFKAESIWKSRFVSWNSWNNNSYLSEVFIKILKIFLSRYVYFLLIFLSCSVLITIEAHSLEIYATDFAFLISADDHAILYQFSSKKGIWMIFICLFFFLCLFNFCKKNLNWNKIMNVGASMFSNITNIDKLDSFL